jgi:ABC-type ATPase with predicted acetyltransferase domain
MYDSDPAATEAEAGEQLYECPECGQRVEAQGSCCCPSCDCEMHNLSQPRHW